MCILILRFYLKTDFLPICDVRYFFNLFNWRRLSSRCSANQILQIRALSGADAVNALRPFYFVVHPDFFGQHPKERVRNVLMFPKQNVVFCFGCKFSPQLLKPCFGAMVFCLQEVNENSLKRLNGYLESLQKPGFMSVKPTKLTFYLRDIREETESNNGVQHSGKLVLSLINMSH